MNQRLQKLHEERNSLQEALTLLQRNLANMESEKQNVEKSAFRLEKDKNALLKTLDKVNYHAILSVNLCNE